MSQTVATPLSDEAIAAALSWPGAHWEVVEGRVVEKPSMGAFAHSISQVRYLALREFVLAHQLGFVTIEGVFIVDPVRDTRRCPDVAFVSIERWPAERELPDEGDYDVVPDLVIEIISPKDRAKDVSKKLREYFRIGVRRVWRIQPETREIFRFSSPKQIEVIDGDDEFLDGGDILPGFRIPLASLFRKSVY